MNDGLLVAVIIAMAILVAVLIIFAIVMWFFNNREERQLKKNIPHYRHDVIVSGGVDVVTGQMTKNDHLHFNGMDDYKFETLCLSGDLAANNSHRKSHSLRLISQNDGVQYAASFVNEVIVGRADAPSSDAVITVKNDNSVSGRHCRIYKSNGAFYIQDLGSSNHTYLNQRILTVPSVIKNGDIIKIGKNYYQTFIG
ncbi:MAG: FHA domain-containing protein [Clostridia bacterium]|nr:FHA domain-containing protein [Clostridia bacterium]